MPQTPIAIFTYNRPQHTQRLLASLAACRRVDECALVIYCDAPKKPEHADSVQATRKIVQAWAAEHGAEVILREENYGLAKSIVTGVTELCEQYGRVIVLEDDLVLAPAFLEYMLSALDHYATDERVYQVSGYTFAFEDNPQPGIFLIPVATTWGWATWKRAWDQYEHEPSEALRILENPQNSHAFDLNGAYPYTEMYRRAAAGKNDSWGIRWWFSIWRRGGLVVYSRQSMIANEGFDGSGTHGKKQSNWQQHKVFDAQLPQPLDFPEQVNDAIFRRYCQYIARHVAPAKPTLWQQTLRRLRQRMRRELHPK